MLLVKRLSGALALSVLCASPASAATQGPAESPTSLGTLPLELGGEVGERMRKSLEAGMSDGLGRGSAPVSAVEGAAKSCDADCQETVGAEGG